MAGCDAGTGTGEWVLPAELLHRYLSAFRT